MDSNFWADRRENNGRNSYWNLFEGKNLNREEHFIHAYIEELENRYVNISFEGKNKVGVEQIKAAMLKARPDILEALTRCCILTYNFVPIQKIVVGEWKRDFSYEQRFAMWRGANFKGIHAYGKAFIDEALDRDVLVCPNLLELHSQMQVKDFSVADVYNDSVEESAKNPGKISVWNSKNPQAQDFVKSYLKSDLRFLKSKDKFVNIVATSNNLINTVLKDVSTHHI